MRITTGNTDATALQRLADSPPPEAAADAVDATPVPVALQSAVLKPAMRAMREIPEIDHQRVAQLRDALAKGQLPFDPAKLAGLIQRFHGGEQ